MDKTEGSKKQEGLAPVQLPRITIQFCTQCKWMLRAAYFAQELLSTFSTSLGEVSLLPSTGGVFTVDMVHAAAATTTETQSDGSGGPQTTRLWDRKVEGGFPEVKQLKRLVRDIIDPGRDLGHVDRRKPASTDESQAASGSAAATETGSGVPSSLDDKTIVDGRDSLHQKDCSSCAVD
ncbi:MAG: hypothetical protein Q9167_000877 [Letrouitia subvulpina]